MKKFLSISLIFTFLISFSQNISKERQRIIDSEKQKFSKKVSNYNVNPNTLNYDLQYQRLELILDPAIYNVAGDVTSHFVPNQSISSIYFDISSELSVSAVKYHGNNISFTQLASDEVKIDFPASISANVKDSLTISYSGAPSIVNDAFTTSTQSGTPVLYTLSEPYGAKDWFPTKQSLNDKIEKVRMVVTAPSQYNVASNGKLISEITTGSLKKTIWQTNYAIPAYLIALGITNYTKLTDTIGATSFPFINYLYPSTASNSTYISYVNWTKQAMNIFEQYFGEYPYKNEKYGHMEFSWSGGMEHATMTSMGYWDRGIIGHELAHQWFGDKLTCRTWNDIWINEGFATFGEHLINEKLLMTPSSFLSFLSGEISFITSSTGGSVYVSDANLSNINAIFSSRLSYSKGGYVLRMLKWILGDTAFYQALKDYNSNPALAYNYASTTDFKNSLYTSTGKDFTEFFNDWIYGQGYPIYNIKWKQGPDKAITFKVSQTQSNASVSYFEMPLPIKVTGTGGQTAYFVLNNTVNNQYFSLPLTFTVSSVSFNYEYQIITKGSVVTQDNTLATDENLEKNLVKVFPNPTKSEIEVSGIENNSIYEIYSSDGKLIQNGVVNKNEKINVQKLEKGAYLIKLPNQTLKFIKE